MFRVNRLSHLTDMINKYNFIIRGISYAQIDPKWKYTNNIYPHNVLYIIKSGEGVLNVNNTNIKLKPNHVYLIPANTYFSTECPEKMIKLYVCANIYNEYHMDIFNDLNVVLSIPYSPEKIELLFKYIHDQNTYSILRLKSEVLNILCNFMELGKSQYKLKLVNNLDSKYVSIMKYISENISIKLRVGDIAKKFNFSQESLSRDFKNAVNINLKKYIDKLIIDKAQQLLITSDLSIQEISDILGFNDRNHFSKYFKKNAKISPSDYRQSNRTE